ncbi:hypothetical protein BD779DRAFT_1520931 [Infundibulicybe gibba]|nr:hypothetical protein BD779DRAFT_1520931 [Infundibulicybe gibba]
MSIWTEHRNPEGRTYWFNTGTRESVWEKPDGSSVLTFVCLQRALNQTKWKEYFSGGRKYYYNLILVLEKVEKEGTAPAATPAQITAPGLTPVGGSMQGALVPLGGANTSLSASSQPQSNGIDLSVGAHTGGLPLAPTSILPARPNLPDDPVIPHNGFLTVEEGEKAFMHLLRKAGVDANWTWDQTMRAIITDPLYKALNTLAEKKAAWEKFTTNLKVKEQEEREARLSKLRPALRNMLRGNPNVFHYTTFPTANKLFSQHPIWQQARIEAERKLILRIQETRAARARATSKIVALFKQLNVDVVTRWRTAHNLVLESDEWNADSELQKLPTLDILLAFEDYSRVREREYEEQMRRAQVEKTRKERKAREAFKELLQDLVDVGKIKARTKWKEIYPSFSTNERYLNMLGNPGSNPLELFWDTVDVLDQQLDAKIAVVEGAIRRRNDATAGPPVGPNDQPSDDTPGFAVSPDTTEAEFRAIVQEYADDDVRALSKADLSTVFTTLREVALKKQADEKRRAERKQRHLQDDLRYALKKLPEPLDLSITYEAAIPLIEDLPEYKALEDDEGRRAAFAKFVKRQKERLRDVGSEDGGSTTDRKRKEPPRDHKEDRDRDRTLERKEKERDKEREKDYPRERERDKERDRSEKARGEEREGHRDRDRERGKEHERESRSSRHHHRFDDYETHGRRSSRDYGRERDRDRDRDRERERDKDDTKDRDGYRSSKHAHHRDDDRRRDRDRKGPRSDYDATAPGPAVKERERSTSVFKEEHPREKREAYEDRIPDERVEKRPRIERSEEAMDVDKKPGPSSTRDETPEEGEI